MESYSDICECTHEHAELVAEREKKLIPDSEAYELAELYKLFGDSTRIKILAALMEGEMCVCDISKTLDMTQSAISHQLRLLKQGRLVKFRKEGKTALYSLADDHVYSIINCGKEHIEE